MASALSKIQPPPKTHIQSGSNTIEPVFVDAYSRYFNDWGSLKKLCKNVYEKLIATQANLSTEQKRENLLIAKYILDTAQTGYSTYLETTIWGKIQRILSNTFGLEFDPDKGMLFITKKMGEVDSLIAIANQQQTPLDEKQMRVAVRKAQISMARTFTRMLEKPLYFSVGYSFATSQLPSRILLTNAEEGDPVCTFNPTKTAKGEGGTRSYYKGAKHSRGGPKEPVGILTTAPTDQLRKNRERIEHIEHVTDETRQESEFLRTLSHSSIAPAGSYFSAIVHSLNLKRMAPDSPESVKIGFRVTPFNEFGDLHYFIENNELYNQMTLYQKLEFLESLVEAFVYLHEQEIVHRDVKCKNIVVVEDNGRYKAVVIDLTTCISPNYQNHLSAYQAGTPLMQAPEYVGEIYNATIKLDKKVSSRKKDLVKELATTLPNVTKTPIDIWGLGQVFFHFLYGEGLMPNLLRDEKYDKRPIEVIHKALTTNLNQFRNEVDSKISEADSKIPSQNTRWGKITEKMRTQEKGAELWNKLIKPMLADRPAGRPSAKGVLQVLRELKGNLPKPPPPLPFSRIFEKPTEQLPTASPLEEV